MMHNNFKMEFNTTPILLCILQHVLAMIEPEPEKVDMKLHLDQIIKWTTAPQANQALIDIQSLAQHLEDAKYLDTAKRWANSGEGMMAASTKDNIYSTIWFSRHVTHW